MAVTSGVRVGNKVGPHSSLLSLRCYWSFLRGKILKMFLKGVSTGGEGSAYADQARL